MKSVKVRPSTGESSNEPKSATCILQKKKTLETLIPYTYTQGEKKYQSNNNFLLPVLEEQLQSNTSEISRSVLAETVKHKVTLIHATTKLY